ncbi:MAG: DUF2478 domain-containing protein [Bradyrhizobium sp.]|uniref:DUF2478 domain-containing protein n=1 Tax=Bradyrhizobium sp. TaxID=376 RepID=UPI0025BEBAD6|nr:DUF2478 domain-containing protein [Bradyrhizobium sp.]MBI5262718.1 DUF2478 domain-containing protein [Bradyrhizobium sp.]
MTADAETKNTRAILAVVYTDGIAADRFLADLGYGLRDMGVHVAGLVQHNQFLRDRAKCDMDIEELASGDILRISEYRGNSARGCRLDRSALSDALGLLKRALAEEPAVLVLNKFGKVEAEGGGVRDTIAEAAELGIAVVVGVPARNLDQWRNFAGDLADESELDQVRVKRWLVTRNIIQACDMSGATISEIPVHADGTESPE